VYEQPVFSASPSFRTREQACKLKLAGRRDWGKSLYSNSKSSAIYVAVVVGFLNVYTIRLVASVPRWRESVSQ